MLITIINTKSHGKFILHRYPYQKIQIQEKMPSTDLMENITNLYDYFGIYYKNAVIQTLDTPLNQKTIVETFMANQKSSQIVLGIDDNCVLISRSMFLTIKDTAQYIESNTISDNAFFNDVTDINKSQVISLSLIWKQQSYNNIEQAKHKLSFLIGVLEKKQQNQNYLTKQISRIMQQKIKLKKRIKDLLSVNTKQQISYEEIRLKILIKQIQRIAINIRQQINLFGLIKRFYQCWVQDSIFQVDHHGCKWQGSIGGNLFTDQPNKQSIQLIQNKTIVMMLPRLNQIPNIYLPERVHKIYNQGFINNHYSIKKLLQKHPNFNKKQIYQTVYFMKRNNLAIDIYPICHPKSYNLFYLKYLPNKSLIQKFNQRIFPGKNLVQILKEYSRYKLVTNQDQILKYLLLRGIIGEVCIYIYKKYPFKQEEDLKSNQLVLKQIIQKYNMEPKSLGELLAVQPCAHRDHTIVIQIFNYIRVRSKNWGFYFVQKK